MLKMFDPTSPGAAGRVLLLMAALAFLLNFGNLVASRDISAECVTRSLQR